MPSALQQVITALETALAGVDGVAIVTTDPGGMVVYPALSVAIGGQQRRDELQGQTDWTLQVEIGIAVEETDAAGLNDEIARLFAAIGDAIEADRTLGGKVWDAKVVDLDAVELIADGSASRKPLAVSTALVEIEYAQVEGDFQTLK